jgi:phosphohistidine phosphatase
MDLFLIRHATAEDGSLYQNDEERALTVGGRQQAQQVGAALKKAGVAFDAMISSGYLRANETAELIAGELGYGGAVHTDARLAPEARPVEIIEGLIAGRTEERLALVGHEPSMGKLLSALLGKPGLSLSKGAAVRLAWDGKRARLAWIVKPKKLDPSSELHDL